jgi:rubrerythrin
MSGGILAWNGFVSKAGIDQGIYLIEGDETPEEVVALAYGLEAATYRFYRDLGDRAKDADTRNSFERLAQDEVHHKDGLWKRYQSLTGGGETREAFEAGIVAKALEDGKTADQILADYPDWTEKSREALELAMSLETDSLDLYLRLAQKSRHKATASVFLDLANEEKKHLKRVGELFRRALQEADS